MMLLSLVEASVAKESIRQCFAQCRCAGQHEFAELDNVRIGFGAVPDTAGVRYRAHNPKPYARRTTRCVRFRHTELAGQVPVKASLVATNPTESKDACIRRVCSDISIISVTPV